jgi:hypothetical protein
MPATELPEGHAFRSISIFRTWRVKRQVAGAMLPKLGRLKPFDLTIINNLALPVSRICAAPRKGHVPLAMGPKPRRCVSLTP